MEIEGKHSVSGTSDTNIDNKSDEGKGKNKGLTAECTKFSVAPDWKATAARILQDFFIVSFFTLFGVDV